MATLTNKYSDIVDKENTKVGGPQPTKKDKNLEEVHLKKFRVTFINSLAGTQIKKESLCRLVIILTSGMGVLLVISHVFSFANLTDIFVSNYQTIKSTSTEV